MKAAVFGTGGVGQTLASKLLSVGYEVMIGTRDVKEASGRKSPDMYGNPGFGIWIEDNRKVKLGTYAEAAAFGEIIINATSGSGSINAFKSAEKEDLKGKIIVDISNPLDFSKGMPPRLIPALSNDNSIGEELQKTFPDSKVVKTLNTMWSGLMVNPGLVGNGDHANYICGNDSEAKEKVKDLLKKFGWKESSLLDLGDISSSRGTEGTLLLWLRVMGATGSGAFNFRIIK